MRICLPQYQLLLPLLDFTNASHIPKYVNNPYTFSKTRCGYDPQLTRVVRDYVRHRGAAPEDRFVGVGKGCARVRICPHVYPLQD